MYGGKKAFHLYFNTIGVGVHTSFKISITSDLSNWQRRDSSIEWYPWNIRVKLEVKLKSYEEKIKLSNEHILVRQAQFTQYSI